LIAKLLPKTSTEEKFMPIMQRNFFFSDKIPKDPRILLLTQYNLAVSSVVCIVYVYRILFKYKFIIMYASLFSHKFLYIWCWYYESGINCPVYDRNM